MEGLGASWGVYSQGPMGLPYQGLKYQKPTVNLLFTTRHTTQTEDALLFTQQKSDTRHFCDYFVYIIKEKKKYRNYTINYHRGLYYLCGHYRKVDVCGFFLMSCHCAMNAWLLSVQIQDCYQR
jgi:hypothetical protein